MKRDNTKNVQDHGSINTGFEIQIDIYIVIKCHLNSKIQDNKNNPVFQTVIYDKQQLWMYLQTLQSLLFSSGQPQGSLM